MTAETSIEILRQVVTERERQRDKFGDQNPPDVAAGFRFVQVAAVAVVWAEKVRAR